MRQKMYVDVGTNSYRLLDKSKLSSKQVPHHVIHTSWEIMRLSKKEVQTLQSAPGHPFRH